MLEPIGQTGSMNCHSILAFTSIVMPSVIDTGEYHFILVPSASRHRELKFHISLETVEGKTSYLRIAPLVHLKALGEDSYLYFSIHYLCFCP